MKAILEFSLPDEQYELNSSLNGEKWKGVVYNIDNWLRASIKYNQGLDGNTIDVLQELRGRIADEMLEENLSLEDC